MIRVLIVDDSLTVRKSVAERLTAAGLDVCGEAADGAEGVRLAHQLRPDVILMDIVMPGMDGLVATRQIMAEVPCPVVVLSAYASNEEMFKTYDALAAGALEVCAKPQSGGPEGQAEWDRILLTIRAAAGVSVVRLRPRGSTHGAGSNASVELPTTAVGSRPEIVVMGASTGGPVAIKEILHDIPPDFSLPILLALHCSPRLTLSVAPWFDRECSLRVRDAQDGHSLSEFSGVVLTVPPGQNMRVQSGCTVLDPVSGSGESTPSIDELFRSVAESYGNRVIGVLLTGMGADGAAGLKQIRNYGGQTIAQDKDSCVVFGMPAAAIALGAAEYITPLAEIAPLLVRLANAGCGAGTSRGIHA